LRDRWQDHRVEVEEIVEVGELDPAHIHTPGIYVDRVVLGTFEKRIEKRTVKQQNKNRGFYMSLTREQMAQRVLPKNCKTVFTST